mmetsp:Transcript_60828/g.144958  ORF Transcript_60828/g.144958 Transcript_60828/m.144958 type:complete len:237 (+) Transcript_60828:247-957(+)
MRLLQARYLQLSIDRFTIDLLLAFCIHNEDERRGLQLVLTKEVMYSRSCRLKMLCTFMRTIHHKEYGTHFNVSVEHWPHVLHSLRTRNIPNGILRQLSRCELFVVIARVSIVLYAVAIRTNNIVNGRFLFAALLALLWLLWQCGNLLQVAAHDIQSPARNLESIEEGGLPRPREAEHNKLQRRLRRNEECGHPVANARQHSSDSDKQTSPATWANTSVALSVNHSAMECFCGTYMT